MAVFSMRSKSNRKVKPAARLGWVHEARARKEARARDGVTVRQLRDMSWALVWSDGFVNGPNGAILPHEQVWRGPASALRVQFFHPITGALVSRVPALLCASCGDAVVGDASVMDKRGRCPCCARGARARRSA
jgi:hypothetical protein